MIPDEDDYELPPADLLPYLEAARKGFDELAKPLKESKDSLTQKVVDRAKPKSAEYTIPHHKIRGLGLRVRPSGSKSYVLTCKARHKKASSRITLGASDTLTLKDAEEIAYKMRSNVREYGDPHGKLYSTRNYTLDQLFEAYLREHGESLSPRWKKQMEQLYRDNVKSAFGHTPLAEISRCQLVACIKANRSPNIQRLVISILSGAYSWGVDCDYVSDHIMKGVRIPKQVTRDRVLADEEAASIFNATFQLPSPFGEYGRFLMLSGQRRTEVARMEWAELDLANKVWMLPAKRSKNKVQNRVPLTPCMVELLESLPCKSGFVFESPVKKGSPINSFTKMNDQWRKYSWVKEWRLHDLRRTLASGMARLEVAPHVIEAVLNHQRGIVSGVAAIYNRYKYDKEKLEALLAWEAHLLSIAEQHKDYVPYNPDDDVVI